MLNTNCNVLGIPTDNKSKAYVNHPCTVWVRSSKANWKFLMELTDALAISMADRHNKQELHKSALRVHENVPEAPEKHYRGRLWLRQDNLQPFAKAMPEVIRGAYEDTLEGSVEAYRQYYSTHKAFFARKDSKSRGKYKIIPATWKHGQIPSWFDAPTLDEALKLGYITGTDWNNNKKTIVINDKSLVSNYEDMKDFKFK